MSRSMKFVPCPNCSRPMNPAREVCSFCESEGIAAPEGNAEVVAEEEAPISGTEAVGRFGAAAMQLGCGLTQIGCLLPILLGLLLVVGGLLYAAGAALFGGGR